MNDQVAYVAPNSERGTTPPRASWHDRPWLIAAGLLALVAIIASVWWATRRPAPVRYATQTISRGVISRSVTATGTVNPVMTIIVGTYVSGVIQQLFCDYNTEVKKGQICAKIDPRPYQTLVDQDKANLNVAKAQLLKDKANLTYAELNSERNATLATRKFVSQDAADSALSLYEQAKAQVALDDATIEQRQAELDAAQVNLDYTDIISPVDGTVVSRNVTMGQTVAATFQTPTLFLIATDLTKMEVDTNVSESDIGEIKQDGRSVFTVDTFQNRVFQGVVTQVRQSPQTVQNVVTYDVVVTTDNADLALKPGMTASVQIVTDQRQDVVRVPDQALRFAPPDAPTDPSSASRIWVLRDGRPFAIPVVTGLDDDINTEIVQGDVQPRDQVIIGMDRGASASAAVPMPRL